MAVDVSATGRIDRPRDEVAAYLRDPANDTTWIGGIRSARLLTPGPVTVGSRVERVASFLGRRIRYVLEITELAGDQLAMRSVRSPFPMRVTYGHRDAGGAATEVSVRVEGDAGRFYALAGPLLGPAVRRSITRDLRNLKQALEQGRDVSTPDPPTEQAQLE
jgi:carbon monoxide dehydrogenase subunit G